MSSQPHSGSVIGGIGGSGSISTGSVQWIGGGGVEDEASKTIAAGLGVVVHILVLISNWFEIVLPNPMKFASSRSLIYDPSDLTKSYSLWEGVDNRDTYHRALLLLQENVAALCDLAGFEVPERDRHLIFTNLLQGLSKLSEKYLTV